MTRRLAALLGVALATLLAVPAAGQIGMPVADPVVSPDVRIERLVTDLQRRTGLVPHIVVQRFGGLLARAFPSGGKRRIVYGDSLVDLLDRPTPWPTRAVLAHEIGHHIAGHPEPDERTPGQEVEADYFAGYLLSGYGATLEQAQSGVPVALEPDDPRTAPRLTAIALGWCAAHQLDRSGGAAAFRLIPKECSRIDAVPGVPPGMKVPRPFEDPLGPKPGPRVLDAE